MNKVMLVGNLTKDPDYKMTQNGTPKCNFTIAVQRRVKQPDGTWKNEADFINCVAWQKLGENVKKYLAKGRKAGVVGSLRTRTYDKDGQRMYITEVNCEDVEFLSPKGETSGVNDAAAAAYGNEDDNVSAQGSFTQVETEDLPF